MATITCPEIREFKLTPKEQALTYDSRVREIDRIVRESWSELAAICIQVRDKMLWKELPGKYTSFDAWLLDAAPVCRATVYRGMGVLSVLSKDVSPEDIAGMEIGNASILAYEVSSSKVRRDPEIVAAAKSHRHSKKLREVVKTKYPEQHLEDVVEKKFHFTASQAELFDEFLTCYRAMNNPNAPAEEAIEELCSSWLDTPWEDSGYSNRQRAEQIHALEAAPN
jgi:hypothetical protein